MTVVAECQGIPGLDSCSYGKAYLDDQAVRLGVSCTDDAPMQPGNFLGDGKADASASRTMLARVTEPIERTKDLREFRLGDAGAMIADHNAGETSMTAELNLDIGPRLRVTNGIANHVFNRAMQKLMRTSNFTIPCPYNVDLGLLGAGLEARILSNLIDQSPQGNRGVLWRINQRLDAR